MSSTSTSNPAELVAIIEGRDDGDIQEIRRTAGVGASEIAAVLGISNWQSELELFSLKRGDIEPWQGSQSTDWGKRHEGSIVGRRAESAAAKGLTVVRPGRIYRSTRYRAMTVSPDALEFPIGVRVNLDAPCAPVCLDDAKTADAFDKKEWQVRIPPQYVLQLQHGAYVLGAERVALDVLFGGNDYKRFEMEADPELGEMLGQAATDFMDRVHEGRPPAAQPSHSGTASLLASLYSGEPGLKQQVSPATAKKLLDLRAYQEQAKWLNDEVTRLRNEVRIELGDATEGTYRVGNRDVTLVSWSAEKEDGMSISLVELRTKHPHLYRMVERRVGKPAGRSTRINLRGKALDAAADIILNQTKEQ